MTRAEITFLYRRDIAKAVSVYNQNLRACWAAWDKPIPLTQECASAMINAWGTCRVMFALADIQMNGRLEQSQCLEWTN